MNLNLQDDRIGERGAMALGQALEKNDALRTLDLRSNDIGATGAATLGESLHMNRGLVELDLRWNNIGKDNERVIARALAAVRRNHLLDQNSAGYHGRA